MKDVRELLARLNPTTVRIGVATGGGGDALTNIDIAGALGMVPAGLGRDLLELLHGPAPSREDIARVFHGITRLVMEEQNRRSRSYYDARTTWGIAECIATFVGDHGVATRRKLAALDARAVVARDLLFPERLEERMPKVAAVAIGYMKGERCSNRRRAAALGISESTYRQKWSALVDWLITYMLEAERCAAQQFRRAAAGARSIG